MPVQIVIEQASGLCAVLKADGLGGFTDFTSLVRAVWNLDAKSRPPESFLTYNKFIFREGKRLEIFKAAGASMLPVAPADIKPAEHNFKRVYKTGEWLYGYRTAKDLYLFGNLRLYEPGLFEESGK